MARTHGLVATYRSGCRCDACRAANRDAQREMRSRGRATVHGLSGYRNYGCRCATCSEAGSADNRAMLEKFKDGVWEPAHGTPHRYAIGCRCADCSRGYEAQQQVSQQSGRTSQAASIDGARRRGTGWEPSELARLVEMDQAGSSVHDMALALGRSNYAVKNRLHKLAKFGN